MQGRIGGVHLNYMEQATGKSVDLPRQLAPGVVDEAPHEEGHNAERQDEPAHHEVRP